MPFKNPPRYYSLWQGMLGRCRNSRNPHFANYGGRGISVCREWENYKVFEAAIDALGEKPAGTTLDRIDNDGNYEPGNVRWANRTTQQRNQRVTSRVVIDGQTYKAVELAEKIGVETKTIIARAQRGLSLAEVLDPTPHTARSGLALGAAINKAMKIAKTHCSKGHEFTAENTYRTKEGWRNCRQCQNAKMRRLNAAKRSKSP